MSRPKTIEEAFAQIESLQKQLSDLTHQVAVLSDGGAASGLALLSAKVETCVQCFQEYKVNGDGHCSYHPGELVSKRDGRNNYAFTCCGESCYSWDDGVYVKGCTKARHECEHHKKHPYKFAHYFWLVKQTKLENEEYACAEINDPLDSAVKKISVGSRTDGKLYVVARDRGTIVYFEAFSEAQLQNAPVAEFFAYKNKVVWAPVAAVASDSNPAASRWEIGKGYKKGSYAYEIYAKKYDQEFQYWLYHVHCDGYDNSYDEWLIADDLTKDGVEEKKAEHVKDHYVVITGKWVLDGHTVKGVELSVKPSNQDTPLCVRCSLTAAGCAKGGDVVTVSEPSAKRKTYTLPAVAAGKASARIPTAAEKKEVKAHLSSGNGPLKLEVVAADKVIFLEHDYNDKTKGNQYVTDNIRVINTAGKCSITKVITQYWNAGGQWADCTSKPGQMYDNWGSKQISVNAGIIPLNIDDKVSMDVAFQTHIVITGSKIAFKDHLHPSLGEVLRVKYTFQLADNTSNEIVSEFVSPPNNFYDQASFMKDNSCKGGDNVLFFHELDDVDFQRRYRVACFVNDSKELVARVQPSSTYHSWTQRALTNIAGQAAAAGKTEYALDPILDKESGADEPAVFRTWLLVDTEAFTVYGIKTTARTATGNVVAQALLPWDKIKAD